MIQLTVNRKDGNPYNPPLIEYWNLDKHPALMTPNTEGSGTLVYPTNSENSYPTELLVEEEMQDIIGLLAGKQTFYLLDVVWRDGQKVNRQYAIPESRVRKIIPDTFEGQAAHRYFFNHGGSGQPASWEFVALGAIPTPIVSTCEAPTNITIGVSVGANGFAQATITWNPANGVASGIPKYNVLLNNNGNVFSNTSNTNSLVWVGLVNGGTYSATVIAYCEVGGETTPPPYIPFSVSVGNTLSTISGITAGSITSTGATINFTAPTPAGVTYAVAYNVVGGSPTQTPFVASTSIPLTGLTANTLYEYTVRTFINGQYTTISAVQTFTTLP